MGFGMDFGKVFDLAFGRALAEILGGIRSALMQKQVRDLVHTLERLGSRDDVLDQVHLAEAAAARRLIDLSPDRRQNVLQMFQIRMTP